MHAKINVHGIVQGIGFRPFVYRVAMQHGLYGYVRNLGDAGVEIVVQGTRDTIKEFIETLKKNAPALSRIDDLSVQRTTQKTFKDFEIKKSNTRKNGTFPSIIPPDIGICPECLKEMRDAKDRRHNYFFTTCTNCGPRYTTIKTLPYDRPHTTMDEFPMCADCHEEYTHPRDRRYHAQTIACPSCGPEVHLYRDDTIIAKGNDAIRNAGALLMKGNIFAVKGNGGFHIACSLASEDALHRIRNTFGRAQKPFAVMTQNIEMAEEIARITPQEHDLLCSYIKPIVALTKKKDIPLVSPGLHTIGIMLPYTGLHVMLFHTCTHPLIMTSANMPGEPIITTTQEALEKLKGHVDYVLTHTRHIYQRCDDSVIRVVDNTPLLIRRSRGYVPSPVPLALPCKNVLALGADTNVSTCIVMHNKAFLSQYIGNTQKYDTLQFLRDATTHLLTLTNADIEMIGCDLHPQFATTALAYELGHHYDVPVHPVQHHHAHIAKVMGEHGVKDTLGIAIDGFGYGDDGTAWGGEILHCTADTYTRIGHLEDHLMPGGDLATYHPLRMAASILYEDHTDEITSFLMKRHHAFPHGKEEVRIVLKQIQKGQGLHTTSCGRMLDAASALLDICHTRTYEGEPAMKLESSAIGGTDLKIPVEIEWKKRILKTTPLFSELFKKRTENTRDLAYSAEHYIAAGLAEIAVAHAEKKGIETVVLAGGCTYNAHITHTIRTVIERHGLKFLKNRAVPPGDGGISFGQAVAAGWI